MAFSGSIPLPGIMTEYEKKEIDWIIDQVLDQYGEVFRLLAGDDKYQQDWQVGQS